METTTSKPKILIVDDTPDNVKVLLNILREYGFEVWIARNGQQALKRVDSAHPDLILLDIMMPDLDGFEVCQRLKSQTATQSIPIIFMTALSETLDKVKGFALGAADYITKPIQHEEVLARVNMHLQLRWQQQHIEQQNHFLQESVAQLEKRNQELDAFARTVAHDLKNPLSTLVSLSEVLMGECAGNAKALERLQMMAYSSRKMFNIINALLMLAGVSCQQKVEIQQLNMGHIVKQVIEQRLVTMIHDYQAKITVANHWPLVWGEAIWVEEIWVNYLSNALKYGGSPPVIELGVIALPNGQACFWVRDNGEGLSEEAQSQVFIPFRRLHTGREEGHGLGLSIVQQMIEKLKGEVGIESVPKQGSLFYFTLPLVDTGQ